MYERRLLRLFVAFAALLVLVLGRTFHVQVLRADDLLQRSPASGTCVLPRRGEILWSDGSPMARNDSRYRVLLDVETFDVNRWRCLRCGDVIARKEAPESCRECSVAADFDPLPPPDERALAVLLRMDLTKLEQRLAPVRAAKRKFKWTTLLQGSDRLAREVAADVALRAAEFPGLEVRAEPARVVDPVARSVVGSTRFPDPGDVVRLTAPERAEQGLAVYRRGDLLRVLLGTKSLERRFDERLRGVPGLVVRVPARDRASVRAAERPAPIVLREVEDGANIRTTLRRALQEIAHDIVSRTPGAAAAVVVLDLRDGAIVAIASHSTDGLNHAVAPREPGSVYKVATAFAVLETGGGTGPCVDCTLKGRLPGTRSPYTCTGSHGEVDFESAFAHSCNPWYQVRALEAGGAALADAARRLGLDTDFDTGIAGEGARRVHTWDRGDITNVAIGQGPVLSSPLQVAAAYARLATGGRLIAPFIVREGTQPASGNAFDPGLARHAPRLLDAAAGVVDFGTARNVPGLQELRAAGKSGTAEVASKTKNNAWFVAFAPREAPRYVAVVLHEHVDRAHGASLAGPDVARLLEEALRER